MVKNRLAFSLMVLGFVLVSSPLFAEEATVERQPEEYPMAVDFNEDCTPVVRTDNGSAIVLGDAEVTAVDKKGNKVLLMYQKEKSLIKYKNPCDSASSVKVQFFGREVMVEPCDDKEILFPACETAEGPQELPNNLDKAQEENPDEGREPMSPANP